MKFHLFNLDLFFYKTILTHIYKRIRTLFIYPFFTKKELNLNHSNTKFLCYSWNFPLYFTMKFYCSRVKFPLFFFLHSSIILDNMLFYWIAKMFRLSNIAFSVRLYWCAKKRTSPSWLLEQFRECCIFFSGFVSFSSFFSMYQVPMHISPLQRYLLSLRNLILAPVVKENKNCLIFSEHFWNYIFRGNFILKRVANRIKVL